MSGFVNLFFIIVCLILDRVTLGHTVRYRHNVKVTDVRVEPPVNHWDSDPIAVPAHWGKLADTVRMVCSFSASSHKTFIYF